MAWNPDRRNAPSLNDTDNPLNLSREHLELWRAHRLRCFVKPLNWRIVPKVGRRMAEMVPHLQVGCVISMIDFMRIIPNGEGKVFLLECISIQDTFDRDGIKRL